MAPFGLVTLAPSGGEGGNDIGTMRWAQTAGYGVLPNAAMPRTFLAQAYDLDDPFSNITCYHKVGCPVKPEPAGGWGGCKAYCDSLAGTNYYMVGSATAALLSCLHRPERMGGGRGGGTLRLIGLFAGWISPALSHIHSWQWKVPIHPALSHIHSWQWKGPIHPRDKRPVGQRLAKAGLVVAYSMHGHSNGPTLSGCSKAGNSITLIFNKTLMAEGGADKLVVQPYNKDTGASKLHVLINASRFCMVYQHMHTHTCFATGTSGRAFAKILRLGFAERAPLVTMHVQCVLAPLLLLTRLPHS